jgi:hypothetical protein
MSEDLDRAVVAMEDSELDHCVRYLAFKLVSEVVKDPRLLELVGDGLRRVLQLDQTAKPDDLP